MKKASAPDYSYLEGLSPLYVLNKKRAHDYMEYYVDKVDDWFIYVVTRVKKDNTIKHVSLIIRKDIADWLSYAKSQGWDSQKMYEENGKN
jgi:hypothetical protein